MSGVVVVGQVGRDLVLTVEELPATGSATDVLERQELLGGKGANQAVACRQLGAEVHLVGVVGADPAGEAVLAQAAGDAFVAALTVALLRGESPESAAWWAAAAAAEVVGTAGGRPDLDLDRLRESASRARR